VPCELLNVCFFRSHMLETSSKPKQHPPVPPCLYTPLHKSCMATNRVYKIPKKRALYWSRPHTSTFSSITLLSTISRPHLNQSAVSPHPTP
jgi:hypothetical protein